MYKGVIFDLDGVIVDSAGYHYQAWKKLANSLDFDFSEEQNEELKGVGRVESLQQILSWGGIDKSTEEQAKLCILKNQWYLELISNMDTSEILPGVEDFLKALKENGVRIALGSASKNSKTILDAVGLTEYFEAIIDGNKTTKSKPDPQTFDMGAEALELDPSDCIVIEDSLKGIEAAKRGGFDTIGIGNPDILKANVVTISDLTQLEYKCQLESLIILNR